MMTLDQAPLLQPLRVVGVNPKGAATHLAADLEDIGFLPGEQAMVMVTGHHKKPWVIKVGLSTFALRFDEAHLVEVTTA